MSSVIEGGSRSVSVNGTTGESGAGVALCQHCLGSE